MADIEITVDGGTSKRLLTAGKYCDRNITVTAMGGGATSSAPVVRKDINFFDYEGTLVDSWTLEELPGKTSLPDNPSHLGLVAQGWNWTLDELKAEGRKMDVGQMYTTFDGKTRLYITIGENAMPDRPPPMNLATIMFSQTISNGVTVDWGDDSEAQTFSDVGVVTATHEYQAAGDYAISFAPTDGCEFRLGDNNDYDNCVMGATSDIDSTNMLRKVELGDNIAGLNTYSFQECKLLKTVSLPKTMTSIESSNAFDGCSSLRFIVVPSGTQLVYGFSNANLSEGVSLPPGVITIGEYAFKGCTFTSTCIPRGVTTISRESFANCKIHSIDLPDTLTVIGNSAFKTCERLMKINIPNGVSVIDSYAIGSCKSLQSLVIPEGVTEILGRAFYLSNRIREYHILPKIPPVLKGTDAFGYMSMDAVMYVPVGSLEAYQTAENWSTYANKMREEGT